MFLQLCLVKFSISSIFPGTFTFIVLFKQDRLDPSQFHGFFVFWEYFFAIIFNFMPLSLSLSLAATDYSIIAHMIFANVIIWAQIKVTKILS